MYFNQGKDMPINNVRKRRVLFCLGLLLFCRPIACITFSDAWRGLYTKIPGKRSTLDFMKSKYGLGILGMTGLMVLIFAGMWYKEQQKAQQKRQPLRRLMGEEVLPLSEEQETNALLAYLEEEARKLQRRDQEFLQEIDQERPKLEREEQEVSEELQKIKEEEEARKKEIMQLEFASPMSELNKLYIKNRTWNDTLTSNFYTYLAAKSEIVTWAFNSSDEEYLQAFQAADNRRTVCATLYGERIKLSQFGTSSDVSSALNNLDKVIAFLSCKEEHDELLRELQSADLQISLEDIEQAIRKGDSYEILVILKTLYQIAKQEFFLGNLLNVIGKSEGTEADVADAINSKNQRALEVLQKARDAIAQAKVSNTYLDRLIKSSIDALIKNATYGSPASS